MAADDSLTEALRQLPEVHLRIFALARDLIDEKGSVDYERAASLGMELDAALREAQAYAETTRRAVSCLMHLARS